MIETRYIVFPPFAGIRTIRRLYVYTPDALKQDENMRLPVLYMFDGHNVFYDTHATYGKSWGMGEYLERTGIPLIVAALECNHGRHHERIKEYSPFDFYSEEFGNIHGKGKETLRWFVQTLKPWMDSQYPTIPDRGHTMIAGSSMGGLMSLYGALSYNKVFGACAALSPSLWVSPVGIRRLIEKSEAGCDTVVYMDYGEKELESRADMRELFGSICRQMIRKKIMLTSRIVPGGEHCEASWERQIPIFMPVILNSWRQ